MDDHAVEKQDMQQYRHIPVEFDEDLRNPADEKIVRKTHHPKRKAKNGGKNDTADRNKQGVGQPHHGSPEMRF